MNRVFVVLEENNDDHYMETLFVAKSFSDVLSALHNNYILNDYDVRDCADFRCVRNVVRKFDGAVVHLHIEFVDYLGGLTYQSKSKQLDETIATNKRLDKIILDLNSRLDSYESECNALLLQNSLLEDNVDKLLNTTVAEYNLQKLKFSRLKWWQRLLFVFSNKLHD